MIENEEVPPPFEASLTVLERNKLLRGSGIVLAALGPVLLASMAASAFPPGIFGIHLLGLGVFLWYSVSRHNLRPQPRRARVRATREGVFVDGKLRVRREDVADGFFQPRRGNGKLGSSVKLLDKRRTVAFEAEVSDEGQALAMLDVLGLGPSRHRAEFRGSSPIYATMPRQIAWTFGLVGVLAALMTLGGAAGISSAPFLMFFVLPLIFVGMIPAKIVVGVDGVLVRWLWHTRFIPMSEIRALTREEDRAIRFHLASGEEVRVYTSMRHRYQSRDAPNHRDAILVRIEESLAAFRERAAGVDVSALVARGARSRAEWLEALRKLRSAEGGYRDAVVRADDLWRVVEDPGAPADARAGAALVLKSSLDDAGRARVRVAAEATASPKLRVVLDAAATKADAELEHALGALDDEDDGDEGADPKKERAAG